jgi:predicted metalloprotease with PDZ domain
LDVEWGEEEAMIGSGRPVPVLLVVCAFLALPSSGCREEVQPAAERPRLDYVLERVRTPEPGLRLTLATTGAAEGRTTFAIYETWGGAPDVAQEVEGLVALGADREPLAVRHIAPHRWSVEHAPEERLELTWFLAAAPAETVGRHRYLPVLSDDLVLLVGHTALIYPDRFDDDQELDARLRFEGFDAPDWHIVTSFGPGEADLRLERTLGELLHAFYVVGKLRLYTRDVSGSPLHIAVAGEDWRFDDASFVEMVETILTYEREFHADLDHPPYTVCLVPYPYKEPDSSSSGGSCLTDSFILYLTSRGYARESVTGLEPLETTIAHEYFHNWNAPGPDDDAMHWFSEGFTVFYERRVLLRLGLFDLVDYLEHLNSSVRRYMTSPVRARPNSDYVESRMLDRELESLPYTRGSVIAILVDDEIRRGSDGERSLDDLMRERAATERASGEPADGEAVLALIEKYTSAEFARSIRDIALDGALAELKPDTYGPCLRMEVVQAAPFELGFDFQASRKAGRVTGVRKGTRAWEAGLRDGQRLVGWSVRHGDADTAVELGVIPEGGERRKIRYMPQATPVAVPRFSLRERAEEVCRELL